MATAPRFRLLPRRWLTVLLAISGLLLLRFVWTLPGSFDFVPAKVDLTEGSDQTSPETNSTTTTTLLDSETQSESENDDTNHAAHPQDMDSSSSSSSNLPDDPTATSILPCANLDGAQNVLVVVKTGATESLVKLPTHFKTTLRCIPHYVIYSDYEEDVDDHHVYDALDDVDENIKKSNSDFEIYNRMKRFGRAGLEADEFTEGTGGTGWRLDKWKFLPLVDKALHQKPDAQWFIFIEADTYLVWPSMLEWLHRFDATKPWYMGSQTQIGDIIFAHGGSGFVVSAPAMRLVSERRAAQLAEYDAFTEREWAGDCVLGKILADVGVPLTWSWPMIQGETPAGLDHSSVGWSKRLWCYPAVTYHHISPAEVSSMWTFEQSWNRQNPSSILHHSNVFKSYILPQLKPSKADWDNLASDIEYREDGTMAYPGSQSSSSEQEALSEPATTELGKIAALTFDDCRAVCEADAECLQFLYNQGGAVERAEGETSTFKGKTCRTGKVIRLGKSSQKGASGLISSGWMVERVKTWVQKADEMKCDEEWVS